MSSDWPILTKLRCKLQRGCYTQATCLATLPKIEGRSTFLATRNAITGLSLRAGGRGFSPATTSLSPGYFDTERKYWKEKNASNYKIMN